MSVRIIEVGPRDGLQNEAVPISLDQKLSFIAALLNAGLKEIEATSFVSPKWVPQLADAAELWPLLPPGGVYSALVPNMKGAERAVDLGASRVAVFTAASEAFTMKNLNRTIQQSLEGFAEVVAMHREAFPSGWIRGYVSTAFECPYAGRVTPQQVIQVCSSLMELGVDELAIGDTIGVAVPSEVRTLIKALEAEFGLNRIAFHFHDTRGTAIANVAEALEAGVAAFDSSAGGLGGCPYAPGAGGNLATEDLVYFLERSGVATGVDQFALAQASLPILRQLSRVPQSKVQRAALASSCPPEEPA